ncbi:hypothetical protein ACH4U3_08785 [Streptomyces griseoruber]|uniref:hypothetical protein n=3 Tax=Streptomyces griseoruber TaxID=1943 RepID=UPI003789AE61
MIKPEEIPQFTGNLFQLELDHAALKKDAGDVRTTGSDVDAQFQGLSAFYKAPEAEQLFATTKPVKTRADDFATDLETVSSALSSYATEIRPLVSKLLELKTKATTFVASVKDDDEWEYDEDKVDEHNRLRDDITATVAAFWAAERTCHNKITAIWGGTQMVAGDGSERKDQYGFNAEDLKNAKLPWGDPVEEKHHWYEVGHWVKSFVWDGLIVDGVWGTIKGLGTLVGFGGWDAMGQAWKGLAQLATGLALASIPGVGTAFWLIPDDKLPSWIRDSRTAMKETGKALVAWDEWGKNPGRAAGAVTFNVLTTVFTGGAGGAAAGAGKAGAVAKALSIAGKAGRVIDPMTYIAKGAGAGLSKIGDISKALKGMGNIEIPKLPENAITLPEGTVHLPDGTIHLPEGAAVPEGVTKLPDGTFKLPDNTPAIPEGSVKLPTDAGAPARYYDPQGNLLDENGTVLKEAADGPGDIVDQPGTPASGADLPRVDTPTKEPALVGAGTHTAESGAQHINLGNSLDTDLGDIGRTGDNATTTPATHTVDHLPGGTADHLPGGGVGDNAARNSIDTPAPASAGDNAIPETSTGDHAPGGHTTETGPGAGHDLPGTGGHDLPGTSGHDFPGPTPDTPHGGGPGDLGDDATAAGHHAAPERPDFMRDGGNPYGPKDSLTPEQIKEIQVYRANHEPGYYEKYYYDDGRRLRTNIPDESGYAPVQMHVDPVTGVKTAASDAPPPIPEKYIDSAEVSRSRHQVLNDETLRHLDEAAAHRRSSIDYSKSAEHHRDIIEGWDDSHGALDDAGNEYKSAMNERTKAAEAFGEAVAEHQVIPELYPNSVRETLHGPANGNDQFDQLWRREDGRFVVVEAKSTVDTKLGKRDVPYLDGKRAAMQGTREYFMDIIQKMESRGRKYPSEARLAADLKIALAEGKVDYILVKGKVDGGLYAGYEKQQFDIG